MSGRAALEGSWSRFSGSVGLPWWWHTWRTAGQGGLVRESPHKLCPAHLHQTWVLNGGQPVDAVGGLAQPQGQEAGTDAAQAGTPRLLLPPVADIDAQGLESLR